MRPVRVLLDKTAWLCATIICCFGSDAAGAALGNALKVGTAAVEITPEVGDVHYRGTSTGVLDPLMAKAVVFRQGERQAALVFCDVIGISMDRSGAVRKLAAEKTGIPLKHICVTATHTHTGRFSDKAEQEAVGRIARAIVEAQAAAAPVKLQTATGRQEKISFHRRFLMRDGSVRMNPGLKNPDIVRPVGPIDPDVHVLLARRTNDDRPVASLTVFAMHLDTVGGTEYSADYPYFLQQTLCKRLGPDFLSLFGTGTCGDINHFDVSKAVPQKGHEGTTKYLGEALAATVIEQLPKMKDLAHADLDVRSRTLQVPLQEVTEAELAWARQPEEGRPPLVEERLFLQRFRARKILSLAEMRRRFGANLPMEVQVVRLSADVAIVMLPGEVFVELGLAIKKASPFATTMVIELANDCPAYIPTRKGFEQGDYEAVNSRVAPGGGEMLVDAAVEMLDELKPGLLQNADSISPPPLGEGQGVRAIGNIRKYSKMSVAESRSP